LDDVKEKNAAIITANGKDVTSLLCDECFIMAVIVYEINFTAAAKHKFKKMPEV